MMSADAIHTVVVPSGARRFDSGFDGEPERRYRLVADGTWIDRSPPAVTADGIAHPGGIRECLNRAKRLPTAPWMALLGQVRSARGPRKWFLIGSSCLWVPLEAGRLECCANDINGFYGNNRGAVTLRVFEA